MTKKQLENMVESTLYNLEKLKINVSEKLIQKEKDILFNAYHNQIAILEILNSELASKYYTTTFLEDEINA